MSSSMGRSIVLAVVLSVTGIAPGDALEATESGSGDEELEEVMVLGQKPVRNPRALAAWLKRLPGRYRSEGTISYLAVRPAQVSRPEPATGALVCAGFGSGPGVQCEMRLTAGGRDTRLDPGVMLLGLDIERPQIRYMTVDDQGMAAGTTGDLRGDTAQFRTPCVATGVRTCYTTTWINAAAGSDQIHFRVDIEMDGRVTARFNIAHSRVN